MTILFVYSYPLAESLATWLESTGARVVRYQEPITPEVIAECRADWVVSYYYKHIIRQATIDAVEGRCLNLHISLLPYNRGADPVVWSYLDGTPQGVTVHQVDAGVDTGPIYVQQALRFDPRTDTLATIFHAHHAAVQDLFKQSWADIHLGKMLPVLQEQSAGTNHRRKLLDPYRSIFERLGYEITPAVFVEEYRAMGGLSSAQF